MSVSQNNIKEESSKGWHVIFIAIITSILLLMGGMVLSHEYALRVFKSELPVKDKSTQLKDEEIKGLFGDSFGAVNALVSALAFAGVIVSLYLQRKDLKLQRHDLKLQREELEMTRKEMEKQTEQYEVQNKTLRVQRFENTFFQMLSQYQEVVNSLSYSYQRNGERITLEGRDIFMNAYESLVVRAIIVKNDQPKEIVIPGMKYIIQNYGLDGYENSDMPQYFDHYFRLIYRILKFVKSSPLISDFDEEYQYTSLLRALLSRYELVWLYYNGLSEYGVEKLKPLMERYAMLKNLRKDLLMESDFNMGEYKNSAFEKTVP